MIDIPATIYCRKDSILFQFLLTFFYIRNITYNVICEFAIKISLLVDLLRPPLIPYQIVLLNVYFLFISASLSTLTHGRIHTEIMNICGDKQCCITFRS